MILFTRIPAAQRPGPPTGIATSSSADEVRVWWRRTRPEDVERCEPLLSTNERARCRRFLTTSARAEGTVARAMARTVLGRLLARAPQALTFGTGAHGKPELAGADRDTDLDFNISHTRGLVTLAVVRGAEVGVDVEHVGRQLAGARIARNSFSSSETRELFEWPVHQRQRRFFDYWTLKEAVLKTRGLGHTMPLHGFSVCLDAPRIGLQFGPESDEDPSAWTLWQTTVGTVHRVGLAVRQSRPTKWSFDIAEAKIP